MNAAAEFAPHTAGLTASIRRELVSSLSVEAPGSPALSSRQIAPAVGKDQATIVRDVQVMHVASPAPTPLPPFDPTTGVLLDPAVGVSRDTVSKDRARQVSDDLTPAPTPLPPFDPTTGVVLDNVVVAVEYDPTDVGLAPLPTPGHWCRDGWLGADEHPTPCPVCRPHLHRTPNRAGITAWRARRPSKTGEHA